MDIDIHLADVPFEFSNAKRAWTTRRIAHVTLHDASRSGRNLGRGECSPLPGYSRHTLDGCRDALLSIPGEELAQLADHFDKLKTTSPLEASSALSQLGLPPAAEFALFSALLDLTQNAGVPPIAAPITTAQLYPLDHKAPPLEHHTHVKVKVGPGISSEHLAELRTLSNKVTVRADFNGAFNQDTDTPLLEKLLSLPFEFIEEPVPFHQLDAFYERFADAPIALDESLQADDYPKRLKHNLHRLSALVLKPSVLGPCRTIEIAQLTLEHRRRHGFAPHLVVSHAFEGALGYCALAFFAFWISHLESTESSAPKPLVAQGLGRHQIVDKDPLASTALGAHHTLIPWKNPTWPLPSASY